MNNPFLNPEDIISGTESAYICESEIMLDKPLYLYDRLKPGYKAVLKKNQERWDSAKTIQSKLQVTLQYEHLTIADLRVLYSMCDLWFHDMTIEDIQFGRNLFER